MHLTSRALARRTLDASFACLVAISLATVIVGRVVPLVGHPTLIVAGGSMEPTLGVGSAIVLDRVDPTAFAVGDIVSLRSGPDQAIYTHRIVRLAERDGALWLETKGDANPAADPSLSPPSAVIGRVGLVLPLLGLLIAFLSMPSGVLFALALGSTLLLARWLLDSPARPSRAIDARNARTIQPV